MFYNLVKYTNDFYQLLCIAMLCFNVNSSMVLLTPCYPITRTQQTIHLPKVYKFPLIQCLFGACTLYFSSSCDCSKQTHNKVKKNNCI